MRASPMASHAKQAFSRVAGPAGRRSFATSTRLETNYGFIGLGQMGEYPVVSLVATTADGTMTGYPMARNLRSKIAESDTLFIHDINPAMSERFEKEVGNVKVVKNVREIAENSVCVAHIQSLVNILLQPT